MSLSRHSNPKRERGRAIHAGSRARSSSFGAIALADASGYVGEMLSQQHRITPVDVILRIAEFSEIDDQRQPLGSVDVDDW